LVSFEDNFLADFKRFSFLSLLNIGFATEEVYLSEPFEGFIKLMGLIVSKIEFYRHYVQIKLKSVEL
jgi:hypothetical protein